MLEQASAHGRLTMPNTRIGSPGAYENDPIGFQSRPMTQFACRHGKNPAVSTSVNAGDMIDLEWRITANHVGDAGVYISYDHDVPEADIHQMEFFKIANIPNTRDQPLPYQIKLPDWLPGGKAVLRWEWYALHVNPTIELYVQCSDIEITPTGSAVDVSTIPKYQVVDASGDPKTQSTYNTGMTMYRDGFDPNNGRQFLTGPECALGFNGNHCDKTAQGTTGWIDMGAGSGPSLSTTTAPPVASPSTPAPVDNPTTPAPVDPVIPNPSNPTSYDFFLDSSSDFNTRKTLANIGGLLAQCAWESGGAAPWHACDENNWSNTATASCTQRYDGSLYHDLTGTDACGVDPNMQMNAVTHASWAVPLECTPGTETEKCCWWGRGAIQTTGPLNYGLLQRDVVDHMGLTDPLTGQPMNLCTNPEAICQNGELKFVGSIYYWISQVQEATCFDSMIDEYAQDWNNNGGSNGCLKYSTGVGGAINNGNWNSPAHGESGRQTQFAHMMTYLRQGYEAYDGQAPAYECTGDAKIDRILELGNMKAESAMEDHSVYTWANFCETVRMFAPGSGSNPNPTPTPAPATPSPVTSAPATTTAAPATTTAAPAPSTPAPTNAPATTTAAPATTPTSSPNPAQCVDNSKQDGAECGGTDYHGSSCCAEGLSCYAESEWYSSCKPSCQAGYLCETQPADLGTTCPERIVGAKCRGNGFTADDQPGCCGEGLQCYKRSWDSTPSSWSGCFASAPTSDWVLDN